jgi:hypothetical protein
MATNPDFKDLLSALSVEHAEYLIVGAHAVMLYTDAGSVRRKQAFS